MICEIINPSDPYTLETEDFVAAAVGILMVGRGALGLTCEDPGQNSPVLFGWDEWLKTQGIEDPESYIKNHRAMIADALDSVLIGDIDARQSFYNALKFIDDPAKREAFRAEFHDRKRSSLNDIGAACYAWAKRLRGETQETPASAAPIILVS